MCNATGGCKAPGGVGGREDAAGAAADNCGHSRPSRPTASAATAGHNLLTLWPLVQRPVRPVLIAVGNRSTCVRAVKARNVVQSIRAVDYTGDGDKSPSSGMCESHEAGK